MSFSLTSRTRCLNRQLQLQRWRGLVSITDADSAQPYHKRVLISASSTRRYSSGTQTSSHRPVPCPTPIPPRPKGWPTPILSYREHVYYKPILLSSGWRQVRVVSKKDGESAKALVKVFCLRDGEEEEKVRMIVAELEKAEKHHVNISTIEPHLLRPRLSNPLTPLPNSLPKHILTISTHTHSACIDPSSTFDGMPTLRKWLTRFLLYGFRFSFGPNLKYGFRFRFYANPDKKDADAGDADGEYQRIPVSGITVRDVRFAFLLDELVGRNIGSSNSSSRLAGESDRNL